MPKKKTVNDLIEEQLEDAEYLDDYKDWLAEEQYWIEEYGDDDMLKTNNPMFLSVKLFE